MPTSVADEHRPRDDYGGQQGKPPRPLLSRRHADLDLVPASFNVAESEVRQIEREGMENQWPPLD
jgi:hypothetical protein